MLDTNKWYNKWKPVDSMQDSEPNLVNEQPLITKKNEEKKEKKRNTMKYFYYNLPFSKWDLQRFLNNVYDSECRIDSGRLFQTFGS